MRETVILLLALNLFSGCIQSTSINNNGAITTVDSNYSANPAEDGPIINGVYIDQALKECANETDLFNKYFRKNYSKYSMCMTATNDCDVTVFGRYNFSEVESCSFDYAFYEGKSFDRMCSDVQLSASLFNNKPAFKFSIIDGICRHFGVNSTVEKIVNGVSSYDTINLCPTSSIFFYKPTTTMVLKIFAINYNETCVKTVNG